ncbi:hypothetical protein [Undibacterium oligocarboniphilum]|uniref:Uncharacterized protein n=1 Tax=Undibacterium oligocarboniphilum TaxID=666702 RepID=A0A850Q8A1_9BURK|nr:hypothetical protein [Undibacterium oligocarboniphilum]MBC3870905.1 hypothetical protein [Undibacterium oligocarboniphilum]NVO76472.1 hypothetical protein [Undibacterium oligocarboniphilum]
MADSLRAQLSNNIRLRIGLALIVATLGTYLTLDQSERVVKKQKEYRRLSVQLAQARQQATDTSWLVRSKEAGKALDELRTKDWTDSNHGLIQSKWNDYLQNLLLQEKAVNATVALSEALADDGAKTREDEAATVPGVSVMRAKLRFEALPRTLYSLLQIIDTNKQTMVVDSLTYNWVGTTGRAEMNLKALTRLSGQSGGQGAAGAADSATNSATNSANEASPAKGQS